MSNPSLRQIAKELEISPAYLSYMLNGKRPWRKDLHQRYVGVVNTFVNSEAEDGNHNNEQTRLSTDSATCRGVAQSGRAPAWGVGGRRFESDHPDQKKKRAVNTSTETSVNSSFDSREPPRLRDILTSFCAMLLLKSKKRPTAGPPSSTGFWSQLE